MESPSMQADFPDEINRAKHIIHKQLFGIAPSTFCQMFSTRTVYGYLDPESNIISINEYELVMKNADKSFLYKTLQKEFNTVKFDVVIGNPPYNNDAYLDFVTLGHQLSNKYTMMITPAKWQAKGGAKNEQFRKEIVPYMEKIVYYPETHDIFEIDEHGGICYYLCDKHVHDIKNIRNICNSNESFNNIAEEDLHTLTLYVGAHRSIINKVGVTNSTLMECVDAKQSKYVKKGEHGNDTGKYILFDGDKGNKFIDTICTQDKLDTYRVVTHTLTGGAVKHFDKENKCFGFGKVFIVDKNMVPSANYVICNSFKTLEEAKSYYSYINTKLIRLLLFYGVDSSTLGAYWFRFVPAPEAFDHIFTDAELYEKYNLTQEEINIIGSVIKERK